MTELANETTQERPVPLEADQLDRGLWSTEIKVRFGDCDPAGIVYTPNFFHLFNVAIERWCEEALGLDYYGVIREGKIGMGYVSAHADFFIPCTMGETLTIAVKVERIGTSSLVLLLHVFQGKKEALRGRMVIVTTDLNEHRAIQIPEELRNALLAYRARSQGR